MRTVPKVLLAITGLATVSGLSFLLWLWPWNRLERSPEATFRHLISPEIPSTVTQIVLDGFDSRYSSDVTITFEMSAEERPQILTHRRYETAPCESGSRFSNDPNDLLDHPRIRECRHISHVRVFALAYFSQDAAHDLTRARFGESGHEPDTVGARDR